MNTMALQQLDKNAEEFVNEYRDASDGEISKIVAGMTAIIDGNETAYENMKNQRWFKRIWYGLTLKNKATVKEMQEKRDQLTKYIVQILVKMNNMMTEHGKDIYDLYRAVAVVRRDFENVVCELEHLAHKLNDKIMSVDNYNFLLNEIRNNKFDANSPLISLVDVMSMIDGRTAKDDKKLIQIKETMEQAGFDFSKKVDIQTYSEEVLLLSEEKVGRILLFCQSFSNRSRFLSYTCYLMENYFYLGESDKRIVRENGEAVQSALYCANLNVNAYCIVGDLFSDLKENIYESFEFIEAPKLADNSSIAEDINSNRTEESDNSISSETKAQNDNDIESANNGSASDEVHENEALSMKKLRASSREAIKKAESMMSKKQLKKCHAIIHGTAGTCAACGVIPIPIADSIPMTSAQVAMVISLGKVFEISLAETTAKTIFTTFATPLVGRTIAGAVLKFVPVIGWTASAAVAACVTEAIGWSIAIDFAKQDHLY